MIARCFSAALFLLALSGPGLWPIASARAADGAGIAPAGPVEANERINEARRQDLFGQQLDLTRRMNLTSGYSARLFEPWPRVPGDVWGYPISRPIEQPVGHESVQTGPNRWTYRPVYAAEAMERAAAAGASVRLRDNPSTTPRSTVPPLAMPGAKVELPGPSDATDRTIERATPRKQPIAPPRPWSGPREF